MTDLEHRPPSWDAWVERACAELSVDPARVDIVAIHRLTKTIAHGLERPLAPVSSFILGAALVAHPELSVEEAVARLEATVDAHATGGDPA